MLRKFGIIAVLALLVTAFAAVPALAAPKTTPTSGVHFTNTGEPVCTITGTTVDCRPSWPAWAVGPDS